MGSRYSVGGISRTHLSVSAVAYGYSPCCHPTNSTKQTQLEVFRDMPKMRLVSILLSIWCCCCCCCFCDAVATPVADQKKLVVILLDGLIITLGFDGITS